MKFDAGMKNNVKHVICMYRHLLRSGQRTYGRPNIKKPYPENNTGIPMNASGEEARKLVDDFANYHPCQHWI